MKLLPGSTIRSNIYSVEKASINIVYQHLWKAECTVWVESEHHILNEDICIAD